MPKSQKPDDALAGSTKRLASRFYQIKDRALPDRRSISTGRRIGPPRNASCASNHTRLGSTSSRSALS